MDDLISRQAAIEAVRRLRDFPTVYDATLIDKAEVQTELMMLPSAQPEHLTDKEQRIFLAAMGREKEVCEEVDRNYGCEPYEDSLVQVCNEIERKVKKTLWEI